MSDITPDIGAIPREGAQGLPLSGAATLAFSPNRFIVADAVEYMAQMPVGVIDLTVTSPPYDNLRDYKGYRFDAEAMLGGLYRVTKNGGVVVWVVGDKINGGRTLSSFEHALIGRRLGFVVRDVMIYRKKNTPFMRKNACTKDNSE
jgi:site-specific DNA-methyltransferase (adenine-specific)